MMACRLWILFGAALLTAIGYSALEIKNCSSGERNVIEYTAVRVTCAQCKKLTTWYVGDDKKYIGNCTEKNCAVQDKSAFRLNASNKSNLYDSTLIIFNISRMDATVVSCKCFGSKIDDKDNASCKLIIKVPISIVPGSCSVDLSGSKVYGLCTIQWLPLRHNNTFTCNWRLTYKSKTYDLAYLREPATNATHDFGRYERRNCSFMVDMPLDDGDYTYSIRVSLHPADHFSKTLYIGNTQTNRPGATYGIAAAAVISAVVGAVIIAFIVKRGIVISNLKTQTSVVRYAAPSGDLYTIVGTAIECHGEDDYVTLPETFENDVHGEGSSNSPQASTTAYRAKELIKTLQSTITSKSTRREICYTNVTQLPTGSGFGVHEGPLRPGFGDTEPDTRAKSAAVNSEDEYNTLHFQVECSGHEDHDNNYSRLELK